MFRSRGNLHRKALSYVIKFQERLNGSHIPYTSSVTHWAVLPSDVIPVRGTRQQNKNNNYILSPTLFRSGKPIQKSLKVCHKNPRETKWRSYSLLIQCDPLSGITFLCNNGQRDKVYAQKLLASSQTSFGVRLSRIHFSPTDRGEEMNAWQTNPKGRLRGG